MLKETTIHYLPLEGAPGPFHMIPITKPNFFDSLPRS